MDLKAGGTWMGLNVNNGTHCGGVRSGVATVLLPPTVGDTRLLRLRTLTTAVRGLPVSRSGCFTALTNYRSSTYPNSPITTTSRGVLLQRTLDEPEFATATDAVDLG